MFAADHKDKEKAFWRKSLWSDERKIGLFGHNDQQYVWKRESVAGNQQIMRNFPESVKSGYKFS